MPHWAQLDGDNVVVQVLRTENADHPRTDDMTSEEVQHAWLLRIFGGTWERTYYDTPGQVYAGIGWTWDGTDFCAPPTLEAQASPPA